MVSESSINIINLLPCIGPFEVDWTGSFEVAVGPFEVEGTGSFEAAGIGGGPWEVDGVSKSLRIFLMASANNSSSVLPAVRV